jgi:hypothetical protein
MDNDPYAELRETSLYKFAAVFAPIAYLVICVLGGVVMGLLLHVIVSSQ